MIAKIKVWSPCQRLKIKDEVGKPKTIQSRHNYNYNKMETIQKSLHKEMSVNTKSGIDLNMLGLSLEQLDSNPRFQGVAAFNGCTDNSNLTAQRPSACLTCV